MPDDLKQFNEHEKREEEIQIPISGHIKPLFYLPGKMMCGQIIDGVCFRFGGEGIWVVGLESLRKIVNDEDKKK